MGFTTELIERCENIIFKYYKDNIILTRPINEIKNYKDKDIALLINVLDEVNILTFFSKETSDVFSNTFSKMENNKKTLSIFLSIINDFKLEGLDYKEYLEYLIIEHNMLIKRGLFPDSFIKNITISETDYTQTWTDVILYFIKKIRMKNGN